MAGSWLLISFFSQHPNRWLFGGLCVVYAVCAINFKLNHERWGRIGIHIATVLAACGGMLSFADAPRQLPVWIQLWILCALFLGAVTLGLSYFSLLTLRASFVDTPDSQENSRGYIQALILVLFARGLHQAGTLLAIPIIDERWEIQIFEAILAPGYSATLVSLTWLTGLFLPILLIASSSKNEQGHPLLPPYQQAITAVCAMLSVWIGLAVHL